MTSTKSDSDISLLNPVNTNSKDKLIICVDFDGVIHDDSLGWNNGKLGKVLPGSVGAMAHLKDSGHTIIIFTCRKDIPELRQWLDTNNIEYHYINENPDQPDNCNQGKPIADVYIDDRAIRHEGDWNTTLDLVRNNPAPWQRKHRGLPRRANHILTDASSTYAQRNAAYGDSYKEHGKIMAALFPNGITLNSVEDFNRFGVFNMMVSKVFRCSANFKAGHVDSMLDLSVYSAMLLELYGPDGKPET